MNLALVVCIAAGILWAETGFCCKANGLDTTDESTGGYTFQLRFDPKNIESTLSCERVEVKKNTAAGLKKMLGKLPFSSSQGEEDSCDLLAEIARGAPNEEVSVFLADSETHVKDDRYKYVNLQSLEGEAEQVHKDIQKKVQEKKDKRRENFKESKVGQWASQAKDSIQGVADTAAEKLRLKKAYEAIQPKFAPHFRNIKFLAEDIKEELGELLKSIESSKLVQTIKKADPRDPIPTENGVPLIKLKTLIPADSYLISRIRLTSGVVLVLIGTTGMAADIATLGATAMPLALAGGGVDFISGMIEGKVLKGSFDRRKLLPGGAKYKYTETIQGLQKGVIAGVEHGVQDATKETFRGIAEGTDSFGLKAYFIPFIGPMFRMGKGYHKIYESFRGYEHGQRLLLEYEKLYQLILDKEFQKRREKFGMLLKKAAQLQIKPHLSEVQKKAIASRASCICKGLEWTRKATVFADERIQNRMSYLQEKIAFNEKRKKLQNDVLGFFKSKSARPEQVQEINGRLNETITQAKAERDAIREAYAKITKQSPFLPVLASSNSNLTVSPEKKTTVDLFNDLSQIEAENEVIRASLATAIQQDSGNSLELIELSNSDKGKTRSNSHEL